MLWRMNFLQIKLSDNFLEAVFLNSEIIYITLCNPEISLRFQAFANIHVATKLSWVSFLKDYIMQVKTGVTSIKLAATKHYLLQE